MHLLNIVVSFGNDCQQNYALDFLRESQGPHVSTSRRSFSKKTIHFLQF